MSDDNKTKNSASFADFLLIIRILAVPALLLLAAIPGSLHGFLGPQFLQNLLYLSATALILRHLLFPRK